MKTIFVVVLVTYDWWRFQKNIYASNNQKDCIEWTKKYEPFGGGKLPIILSEKSSDKKDKTETSHLWIQAF